MFAFYLWNFWWRTLYMAFIHSIFRQYVAVRIVFIKLINLVLLHMASPCVDFAGFSRGGIPSPSFFSFDFFWSFCFSHSFMFFLFPFSFSSLSFSFSNCLVVLFCHLHHMYVIFCLLFLGLEEKWKNVLYTLRYDLNFKKCDKS